MFTITLFIISQNKLFGIHLLVKNNTFILVKLLLVRVFIFRFLLYIDNEQKYRCYLRPAWLIPRHQNSKPLLLSRYTMVTHTSFLYYITQMISAVYGDSVH